MTHTHTHTRARARFSYFLFFLPFLLSLSCIRLDNTFNKHVDKLFWIDSNKPKYINNKKENAPQKYVIWNSFLQILRLYAIEQVCTATFNSFLFYKISACEPRSHLTYASSLLQQTLVCCVGFSCIIILIRQRVIISDELPRKSVKILTDNSRVCMCVCIYIYIFYIYIFKYIYIFYIYIYIYIFYIYIYILVYHSRTTNFAFVFPRKDSRSL